VSVGKRKPSHWFFDSTWPWLRREFAIAAVVAGGITGVVMVRRWVLGLLDQGLLNQAIMADSGAGIEAIEAFTKEVERRFPDESTAGAPQGANHARTAAR